MLPRTRPLMICCSKMSIEKSFVALLVSCPAPPHPYPPIARPAHARTRPADDPAMVQPMRPQARLSVQRSPKQETRQTMPLQVLWRGLAGAIVARSPLRTRPIRAGFSLGFWRRRPGRRRGRGSTHGRVGCHHFDGIRRFVHQRPWPPSPLDHPWAIPGSSGLAVLESGDAVGDFLARGVESFPAQHLDPLARFQVLVMLEEMADRLQ